MRFNWQIIKKHFPYKKYISGADTFIRHLCLSKLLKKYRPELILDVGGEGLLTRFIRGVKVVSANIKKADVRCPGQSLPFKDNSFDVVVSIDTIEHIPKIMRLDLCKELLRVAHKGIVLCAPFGTSEHLEYEKEVLSTIDSHASEIRRYLAEHVKYGLPTPEEVKNMAEQLRGEVFYQGDFRKIIHVSRLLAYPCLAWQTLGNFFRDIFWLDDNYLKKRVYSLYKSFFPVG